MTFKLGLTGNMGMGKSYAAAEFVRHGWKLWDADEQVHGLYAKGGRAITDMAQIVPDAIVGGAVDRVILKTKIAQDPTLLTEIEELVHRLLSEERQNFINDNKGQNLIFDIPLLFENALENHFHATATVHIKEDLQQQRVIERGTMSAQDVAFYLARQMPIEEKLKRSTFAIDGSNVEAMTKDVAFIIMKTKDTHHA